MGSSLKMGQEEGVKGEYNFIAELNKIGIPYSFVDDWYDFEVLGQKVEVKSCRLTILHGNGKNYQIGRFDFTDEDNRERQYKENVWVCFILRYRDEYLVLGLVRAKKLKKKRYISLHMMRELKPVDIKDFVEKYQK